MSPTSCLDIFASSEFIAAGWRQDGVLAKFVNTLAGCPQVCQIEVAHGPMGAYDPVITIHYGGRTTPVPRIGRTFRLAPPAPAHLPGGPVGIAVEHLLATVSRALYGI